MQTQNCNKICLFVFSTFVFISASSFSVLFSVSIQFLSFRCEADPNFKWSRALSPLATGT